MSQSESTPPKHPAGKHRYKSVIDGCAMVAQFRRSGLTIGEFTRQTGISRRMVDYWTRRERELARTVSSGFVEVTPAIPAAAPLALPAPAPSQAEPAVVAAPSRPATGSASIEIRLPGGPVIAVGADFDPGLLRAVIACLGSTSC